MTRPKLYKEKSRPRTQLHVRHLPEGLVPTIEALAHENGQTIQFYVVTALKEVSGFQGASRTKKLARLKEEK